MRARFLLALVCSATLAGVAFPAHAELAAWDAAKLQGLAKQLVDASKRLYDVFYKQPKVGAGQAKSYYRLKQHVRHVRSEAKQLSAALQKGAGYDETLPMYEDLMQEVRSARQEAAQVFTTRDVQEQAAVARGILNQITPYYDPDAVSSNPSPR